MTKKKDKLNLSDYTPGEIAKRMLETPPEKREKKSKAQRKESLRRITQMSQEMGDYD